MPKNKQPPPMTIDANENQMILLAMDQARHQLENKTAPAQVVVHFLKAGSIVNQLEKERIAYENSLIKAKAESALSGDTEVDAITRVTEALKLYNGIVDE